MKSAERELKIMISREQIDELHKFMKYHAKRCPHCEDSNFSSDLHSNHFCYTCNNTFTDETALPSLASLERIEND